MPCCPPRNFLTFSNASPKNQFTCATEQPHGVSIFRNAKSGIQIFKFPKLSFNVPTQVLAYD